jgi:hypothetical protein
MLIRTKTRNGGKDQQVSTKVVDGMGGVMNERVWRQR